MCINTDLKCLTKNKNHSEIYKLNLRSDDFFGATHFLIYHRLIVGFQETFGQIGNSRLWTTLSNTERSVLSVRAVAAASSSAASLQLQSVAVILYHPEPTAETHQPVTACSRPRWRTGWYCFSRRGRGGFNCFNCGTWEALIWEGRGK